MKYLATILALLCTSHAMSQTAVTSLDGTYERRDWKSKDRPMLDADLTIKGNTGTFHDYAPKKAKLDGCIGKPVPMEVVAGEGGMLMVTIKRSAIMASCTDFTTSFQSITANGKTGLAMGNSGEIMFIKK